MHGLSLEFSVIGYTARNRPLRKKGLDSTNMTNIALDRDASPNDPLSASIQVLPLPPGLYLFSVKAASLVPNGPQGVLRLPAMHVGLGPGVRSEQVEFIAGPATDGAWLFAHEDLLVTKVKGVGATLILTSVRAPGGEVLSIKVERLEGRAEATAPAQLPAQNPPPVAPAGAAKKSEPVAKPANDSLALKISAHVRARGDMDFSDVPWAGRVAPGLWIESFSIKPLERFEDRDIEYKGLTGSGFETPWLSEDKMCGTKGLSVPLVGYAVRLKPSPQSAAYDCEYSGYFKSGATVGPLRNGAPCRSTVANDPLEGIQVRIFKRVGASKPASLAHREVRPGEAPGTRPPASGPIGPSFGRYRDDHSHAVPAANGTVKSTRSTPVKGKAVSAVRERKPAKTHSLPKRSDPEIRAASGANGANAAIAANGANGAMTATQRPIARRS